MIVIIGKDERFHKSLISDVKMLPGEVISSRDEWLLKYLHLESNAVDDLGPITEQPPVHGQPIKANTLTDMLIWAN